MGVGFPLQVALMQFGQLVYDAFGSIPYQVGSSLTQKRDWRDVDVRLILSDSQYASQGFGDPEYPHDNPRWMAMCVAFSHYGRQITGLPIDFQIQQQTKANADFPGPRSALFNPRAAENHSIEEAG